MAFSVKKAVKKKAKPQPKPIEPIFIRARREAIAKMSNPDATKDDDLGSIEMAEGRYGKNAEAFDPPKAAYNWKLPQGKKTKWPKGKDGKADKSGAACGTERVELRMKAGGVAVPALDDEATGEKNCKVVLVRGEDLVDTLEGMLSHLKGMKQDSDTGQKFHKVAIKAAMPKFGKGKDKPVAYDPSKDLWKTFNTKDTSINDLRSERQNWLKRNKAAADHYANGWGTKGNGTSK